jgi:predicted metal-dependent hydrolase
MTLRLAPDGSAARVSMPTWARTADALAFVRERADWLAAQLERLPARRRWRRQALPFRGDRLILDWDRASAPPGGGRRPPAGGRPREQLAVRAAAGWRPKRCACAGKTWRTIAPAPGCPVPALGLSSATRRWGSCAADGSIRINWRLIMAPDAVRRSVVAHEVAHLVHFDHSPAFHALLDAVRGERGGGQSLVEDRRARALPAVLKE